MLQEKPRLKCVYISFLICLVSAGAFPRAMVRVVRSDAAGRKAALARPRRREALSAASCEAM